MRRPGKSLKGKKQQEGRSGPSHGFQNQRVGPKGRTQTAGPQRNKQGISQKAHRTHGKHMLAHKTLAQNQSVLWANRNNESAAQGKPLP